MDIWRGYRRVFGGHTLGDKSRQHTREHIARTPGGEGRRTGGIEVHLAVGTHDGGKLALEDDDDVPSAGHVERPQQTGIGCRLLAEEAVKLARMGSQDRHHRDMVEHRRTDGDAVEGIGIKHERTRVGIGYLEKAVERVDGILGGTDAGTYGDGRVLAGELDVADGYVAGVVFIHGTRHGGL